MWSKYFLLLGVIFIGTFEAIAQSDKIVCNFENLYRITLSESPSLQRQSIQNRKAETDKQFASGFFDYQLYTDLSLGRSGLNLFDADPRKAIVGNQINTNNVSLSAGMQRVFRTGLSASIGLEYSRISDNYPFNAYNENIGSFFSTNNTTTTLSVTQPLFRGRGKRITTAYEKVADIGIESELLNTAFVSSGEVLNMAISYWQYLGASKSLEIYKNNESRINKVLEITEELVKAEKKPSVDLLQIQAERTDKERQTIQAAHQLYSVRQNLGRQIGLSTAESEYLGSPMNDYPGIEDIDTTIVLQELIDIAHQNRKDLKALKKSLDILGVYLDVAENNTKPQLDLRAFVSYGGTHAGNSINRIFTALGQNEGRNYQAGIGLGYVFPLNNNRAEANLLNSRLQHNEQEILIKDQIRNIELNVSIAFNNYLNTIEALKKSGQALTFYKEVFENERFKFQTGLTTLLNLIIFQERLTFAQLDYIQNQQQFAIAISRLRYETGTLLPSKDNQINQKVFYTLPKK